MIIPEVLYNVKVFLAGEIFLNIQVACMQICLHVKVNFELNSAFRSNCVGIIVLFELILNMNICFADGSDEWR